MGRPRLHDEHTRAELLRAAEARVAAEGSEALSVRGLAEAVGTSTRAVYSVFGGKEGIFRALYAESFLLLMRQVEAIPLGRSPLKDLVRMGKEGFRTYALEHPNLFRLVFERIIPDAKPSEEERAVGREALALLQSRVQRCADAGLLRKRSVGSATAAFHALCQGLASMELQGWLDHYPGGAERVWEETLTSLVKGFGTQG